MPLSGWIQFDIAIDRHFCKSERHLDVLYRSLSSQQEEIEVGLFMFGFSYGSNRPQIDT